jgi:hypothetical protein
MADINRICEIIGCCSKWICLMGTKFVGSCARWTAYGNGKLKKQADEVNPISHLMFSCQLITRFRLMGCDVLQSGRYVSAIAFNVPPPSLR